MGKRGPAKKPSAIEKLQGNPGRRPSNKKEPKPDTGIPTCPRWLDGIAKYAFKELGITLEGMQVLTLADKKALELLCDAYSEYRRARAIILKEGSTFTSHVQDKDGNIFKSMVRLRPEVAIAKDAWRRCADMLKQFGLTPSARTGVNVAQKDDKTDPLDEFRTSGKKLAVVKNK